MKKIILISSAVLLTVIIFSFVALFVFSPTSLAEKVQASVKKELGRDFNFASAEFALWPDIGIKLKGVTLSNSEGSSVPEMISLEKINVAVAFKPLLSGDLIIKNLLLVNPVINLEKFSDGKNNWNFSKDVSVEEVDANTVEGQEEKRVYKFGNIKLEGGKVVFIEGDKSYSIENINVDISLPDLQSALNVKGFFNYQGKKVDAEVSVDKVLDFLEGKTSPGIIVLAADNAKLSVKGDLSSDPDLLDVDADLDVSSVSDAVLWLNGDSEMFSGFKKLRVVSEVTAEENSVTLKNLDVQLDNVKITGDLDADFAEKTKIFARLVSNRVNIDNFISKINPEKIEAADEEKVETVDDSQEKDIDFSFIKKIDADIELKSEGFVINKTDIGGANVKLSINDNKFSLEHSKTAAFNGKVASKIDIDVNGKSPKFIFDVEAKGLNANEVIKKFSEFDKIDGKMNINLSVKSLGSSKEKIISELNGNGSVSFKNGTLKGLDILDIVKKISVKDENVAVGSGKTDFIEMGGDFTVNRGVISSDPFKLKNSALKVSAKGTIDLPRKKLDCYLTPTVIIASVKTGKVDANLDIPLFIKGGFNDIKVTPDLAAVAKKAIENPEGVKQAIENAKDNIKGKVEDVKDSLKRIKEVNVDELKTETPKIEEESSSADSVSKDGEANTEVKENNLFEGIKSGVEGIFSELKKKIGAEDNKVEEGSTDKTEE